MLCYLIVHLPDLQVCIMRMELVRNFGSYMGSRLYVMEFFRKRCI